MAALLSVITTARDFSQSQHDLLTEQITHLSVQLKETLSCPLVRVQRSYGQKLDS